MEFSPMADWYQVFYRKTGFSFNQKLQETTGKAVEAWPPHGLLRHAADCRASVRSGSLVGDMDSNTPKLQEELTVIETSPCC